MFVKKLFPDAKLPERANPTDSGADIFVYRFEKYFTIASEIIDNDELHSQKELVLRPGERAMINAGVVVTYGKNYEIQVRPRSGNALKRGLTVLNTPGTIDESYRGLTGVIIINLNVKDEKIQVGEKIAQLVVCPVIPSEVIEVEDFDKTERNEKGFGSSGI